MARVEAPSCSDLVAVERALLRDYPGLVTLLGRRCGDRQLARDLLHDAIVTALDKLAAGAAVPPAVLAGFVFRTAMNHLRNHQRHLQLRCESEADIESFAGEADSGPEAQSQRAKLREIVRRVLQGLSSSRDREVLIRYYLDEEDKSQICESYNLSGAQFDRVIFRARDRLRALVERTGYRCWDLLGIFFLVLVFALGR